MLNPKCVGLGPNEMIEKQSKYAEAYARGAATSVQRAINESLVNQYAPKLLKKSGLTEATLQTYIESVSKALR